MAHENCVKLACCRDRSDIYDQWRAHTVLSGPTFELGPRPVRAVAPAANCYALTFASAATIRIRNAEADPRTYTTTANTAEPTIV